jgi:predicted small secreted protein
MKRLAASVLAVASCCLAACSHTDTVGYDFQFSRGPQGWTALFADYPADNEAIFDLVADYRALPEPLNTSQNALYIAGTNRSDDLWMQYKVPVTLPANTTYLVSFEVQIATDVPSGCGGVGGAPGEGVTVKAGVSVIEPDRYLDGAGWWRMNVDKGSQTVGGEDAVVIGDLANSRPCDDGFAWELKQLQGPPMTFTTDSTGRAWLFVGTDSGFEARSSVYYTRFGAVFQPM